MRASDHSTMPRPDKFSTRLSACSKPSTPRRATTLCAIFRRSRLPGLVWMGRTTCGRSRHPKIARRLQRTCRLCGRAADSIPEGYSSWLGLIAVLEGRFLARRRDLIWLHCRRLGGRASAYATPTRTKPFDGKKPHEVNRWEVSRASRDLVGIWVCGSGQT